MGLFLRDGVLLGDYGKLVNNYLEYSARGMGGEGEACYTTIWYNDHDHPEVRSVQPSKPLQARQKQDCFL